MRLHNNYDVIKGVAHHATPSSDHYKSACYGIVLGWDGNEPSGYKGKVREHGEFSGT